MISLITPTQGNVVALERTIKSLLGFCNEFVVGSVMVFDDDKLALKELAEKYPIKIVDLPFNYIYKNGFSETLNTLANAAKNKWVLYLNVSEIMASIPIVDISDEYNCYYIDHGQEKHRWFRLYNKEEMKWSGLIHEEIVGNHRPFHKPIFRFADTEKDQDNKFKAAVFNDIKEMVYWKQLMRIVDEPEVLGATSEGWVHFAKENYETMQRRLKEKGYRPLAFENDMLHVYMKDAKLGGYFEKERFESNHIIEFQGSPLYLGKK